MLIHNDAVIEFDAILVNAFCRKFKLNFVSSFIFDEALKVCRSSKIKHPFYTVSFYSSKEHMDASRAFICNEWLNEPKL